MRQAIPGGLRRDAFASALSPNHLSTDIKNNIQRLTPDMGFFIKKPLFPLGKLLIAEVVNALDHDIHRLLKRHQSGDFGCIDEYDVDHNHHAIECAEAILSQYHVMVGEKKILICIMTESDRSYTVAFVVDQKKLKSPEAPENGNNQPPE